MKEPSAVRIRLTRDTLQSIASCAVSLQLSESSIRAIAADEESLDLLRQIDRNLDSFEGDM